MTLMTTTNNNRALAAHQEAAEAALAAETLPLLGVLRKGAPKQGNKPGRELPYFRVDWRPGYEYLAPIFEDLYGPEPDRIGGVQLIGARPFQHYYEAWHGNATLKARHNGEVFLKRWTEQGYDFEPVPVEDHIMLSQECVMTGRLFFWLPALAARTFEIGKFIAITTSPNDCAQLDAYVKMARRIAPIYQASFELFREPRKFTVPINGKPSVVEKHMIRLRLDPESARAALAGSEARMLDETTGELIEAGDVIEAEEVPARGLTMAEAQQITKYWRGLGLSDSEALEALGVERLSEWTAGDTAAYQVVADYLEKQLEQEQAGEAEQQALIDVPETPVQYE